MEPSSYPIRNQRWRCSADPCVQPSGLTRPVVCCWIRSSPTDLAAATASAMSWSLMSAISGTPDGVLGRGGGARPHAGVAVGLQLEAYGVAQRALLGAHLAHGAGEVLDVVAVLVGEHVGLHELTRRPAELALQHVLEERRVEVDALVGRAVERPDLGGGLAAAGVDRARERGQLLLRGEGDAGLGLEGVGPEVVEGVLDGHPGAVLVLVGVRAGLAVGVAVAVAAVDPAGVEAVVGERRTAGAAAAQALGEHDEQDDDHAARRCRRRPWSRRGSGCASRRRSCRRRDRPDRLSPTHGHGRAGPWG